MSKVEVEVTEDADGKVELTMKKTPIEVLEEAFGKRGPNLQIFNEIDDRARIIKDTAFDERGVGHSPDHVAEQQRTETAKELRRAEALARFKAQRAAEKEADRGGIER